MKILVLSDSHGYLDLLEKILQRERSAELIIHLGDGAPEMLMFSDYTTGKGIITVRGNCDSFTYNLEESAAFTVEDVRIFACHGHKYNVKYGLYSLGLAGAQAEAKICLFGHTHSQTLEEYNGITLFNPGAVCRGEYGTVTVKNGKITTEHKLLQPDL